MFCLFFFFWKYKIEMKGDLRQILETEKKEKKEKKRFSAAYIESGGLPECGRVDNRALRRVNSKKRRSVLIKHNT